MSAHPTPNAERLQSTSDYSLRSLSQHKSKVWKGWIVGSYLYAWLPVNAQTWRNYPVVLVDICKEVSGDMRLIVAHLYDQDAVIQRLQTATRQAQLQASIILRAWPQEFKYITSNHYESVYGWDLRTWSRSNTESITTRWAMNIHTNRLEFLPGMETRMALDTTSSLSWFLQLPCEIRDQIYDYTMFDERQKTTQSYIFTRSLLHKRESNKKGQPWQRDLSMPTLGPLPRLQTPNIFLVCKQIRTEALNTIYRTKTLVITVTSPADIFQNDKNWPPLHMIHFSRMRIDLILDNPTPDTLRECFSGIVSLLQAQALSLQFLEVRIGYSGSGASVAVRRDDSQLIIRSENIADSMQELIQLVKRKVLGGNKRDKPLHISWGISAHQRSVGDYSCTCKYWSTSYLRHLWSFLCEGGARDTQNIGLLLLEEDCQDMGCKLNHS
jgi:hypothetical protein